MANFSRINQDNLVEEVCVIDNSILLNPEGVETEQLGIDFLTTLTGRSGWLQTSYTSSRRGSFGGIGSSYYPDLDIFMPPSPHKAWLLKEQAGRWAWVAPLPPIEGATWDDELLEWNFKEDERLLLEAQAQNN